MEEFLASLRRRVQRAVHWILRSAVRTAFSIGVAFSVFFLVVEVGPWNLAADWLTFKVAAAVVIFGTFVGIIFVTERMRSPLEASLVRVAAGGVAGSAVTLVFGVSVPIALASAVIGALLGFFGSRWAHHV